VSLDVQPDGGGMDSWLATTESGFDHAEDRDATQRIMDRLGERDRRILSLRYFEGRTQSEIAAEVGVSQMHISRLLAQITEQLRARMAHQ
jgi:RNA polymerase sigma-B factor